MAEPKLRPRPRSPFFDIYRWPLTMLTSILHRVTGIGIALGGLLLACWLVALALGPDSYARVQAFHGHFIGRFLLFGFTWALVYHWLNGIRHLAWDVGIGFDKQTGFRSGLFVLLGSVGFTLVIWALAYMMRGQGL